MADGREILLTTLLDLLVELQAKDISVLLGGGYGLYLKQSHLADNNIQTLIDLDLWPPPRATQDLDILLPAELIVTPQLIGLVPSILEGLGCRVIENRKYYQFRRSLPDGQEVKIDLLAPHPDESLDPERHFKVEGDRVKPKPRVPLHGRLTLEAVALSEEPFAFPIQGTRSNGAPAELIVRIPQGFTYLMMKMFAFRDYLRESESTLEANDRDWAAGRASIHAVDTYRVVAMLTEAEASQVLRLAEQYRQNEHVQKASHIANEYFGTNESPGTLRIRRAVDNADTEAFLDLLSEVFAPTKT